MLERSQPLGNLSSPRARGRGGKHVPGRGAKYLRGGKGRGKGSELRPSGLELSASDSASTSMSVEPVMSQPVTSTNQFSFGALASLFSGGSATQSSQPVAGSVPTADTNPVLNPHKRTATSVLQSDGAKRSRFTPSLFQSHNPMLSGGTSPAFSTPAGHQGMMMAHSGSSTAFSFDSSQASLGIGHLPPLLTPTLSGTDPDSFLSLTEDNEPSSPGV
jgi:hypothetical protein